MTREYASLIAEWTYDEPYSIYSMDGSKESISELMNGEYFHVLNTEHILIGFICIGNSARVPGGYEIGIYNNSNYVDVGLGIKPEFTNKGIGFDYLISSIQFIKERFNIWDFQLVVAAFNERAIKVYERAGFVKGVTFKSRVEEQEIDFIVMNYSIQT
jgi:RimJ/RimL family protein N-acetyltransferase